MISVITFHLRIPKTSECLIFHYFMIIEYLNNELWENQWKAEIEVWFYKNISGKNFVVKFISFHSEELKITLLPYW